MESRHHDDVYVTDAAGENEMVTVCNSIRLNNIICIFICDPLSENLAIAYLVVFREEIPLPT